MNARDRVIFDNGLTKVRKGVVHCVMGATAFVWFDDRPDRATPEAVPIEYLKEYNDVER